jgi:hypothetical protein
MGQRGPVPNPESDLARPRSRKGADQQPVTYGLRRGVSWPDADEDWHPIATMLWDAAKESGQTDFYQQTDIALLWSLCDDITHYKKSGKRSGQMLDVIYKNLGSLLITEGDRRRVRIELTEPQPEEDPAAVFAIAQYRDRLSVKKEEE